MAVHGSALNYVLLKDVSDDSSSKTKLNAYNEAMIWPGFPKNLISPNPINVVMENWGELPVKPVKPLEGRKTQRGNGRYVSLVNYNNIP